MGLYLIAAIGQQGQLGLEGKLPWAPLTRDMQAFRNITCAREPMEIAEVYTEGGFVCINTDKAANAVIMGRRTWDGLPGPLVGRENIIVSSTQKSSCDSCHKVGVSHCSDPIHCGMVIWRTPSLNQALAITCTPETQNTFIIGGAQVYAEALRLPQLEVLFLTEIAYTGEADTWWPWLHQFDWDAGMGRTFSGRRSLEHESFPERYATHWRRTHVSPWIEEPERRRFRFGIWVKG